VLILFFVDSVRGGLCLEARFYSNYVRISVLCIFLLYEIGTDTKKKTTLKILKISASI